MTVSPVSGAVPLEPVRGRDHATAQNVSTDAQAAVGAFAAYAAGSSAPAARGMVKEDETLTTSGNLNVTNSASGRTRVVAETDRFGECGSFEVNGNRSWTYRLNNASGAVQALGAGEMATMSYSVTTPGGTTTKVPITIEGTNDAPTIAGEASGILVLGAGDRSVSGQLTVSDVDQHDRHTWSIVGNGDRAYGKLTLSDTGHWTYTINNEKVPQLKATDVVYDFPKVRVTDNHGGTREMTISIFIKGTPTQTPASPSPEKDALDG
ncbi:hypothetical protein CAL14_08745 [Bordetella genomosp. 9]|uniref:VCBS domain-containing protein n=1 Tax=Bordetella genomosp. 9 TaxID=1416803 RepID=UPI000A293E07|nr:VCBS domain-containing protein [Bordetella genomosp. 9]ARP90369.1 hypothetical protein CAL14_08745 [Bordetella genomosp. 9]